MQKIRRMSEEEYRSRKGVNKSSLWWMERSPAHYKYAQDHPQVDTAALRVGRALHSAVLTPRLYKRDYAVLPDGIDRRTKAGKEAYEVFMTENEGKNILSYDEAQQVTGMAAGVLAFKPAQELLAGTQTEVPLFWKDKYTEIDCKCRVDAIKDGIVIDLKTAADGSTDAFMRDSLRRGYDVQAAFYSAAVRAVLGWNELTWYFIVIEKDPPYAVNVLKADNSYIDRGTIRAMGLMEKLKECLNSGVWDAYGVNELILPSWAEIVGDE